MVYVMKFFTYVEESLDHPDESALNSIGLEIEKLLLTIVAEFDIMRKINESVF